MRKRNNMSSRLLPQGGIRPGKQAVGDTKRTLRELRVEGVRRHSAGDAVKRRAVRPACPSRNGLKPVVSPLPSQAGRLSYIIRVFAVFEDPPSPGFRLRTASPDKSAGRRGRAVFVTLPSPSDFAGQVAAPRNEDDLKPVSRAGLCRRGGSYNRAGFGKSLAPAVIHVDELFRLGDVKDDVEFANRFFFRNVKGRSGCPEVFAFGCFF
jgi:hypothetical protein